jgi:hypothetical protein
MRQDGLVLLVVIDNEKSKVQQPGEQAAPDPAGQIQVR